mmetsp:Transcript_3388/g.6790  ORF Transcript_3388/g.6790 Transcript_3388/m.6790 type:complete len:175 (-) Transcript_3388:114-638(-)
MAAANSAGGGDLAARLRGVGVEAPPPSGGEEAWRSCLAELCGAYLGEAQSAGAHPFAPLTADQQLEALRLKEEAYRRRSSDLRRELDLAARREATLRERVAEDPVLEKRSLGDLVACLRAVREGCVKAAAEEERAAGPAPEPPFVGENPQEARDPSDLGDLLATLEAARVALAP